MSLWHHELHGGQDWFDVFFLGCGQGRTLRWYGGLDRDDIRVNRDGSAEYMDPEEEILFDWATRKVSD